MTFAELIESKCKEADASFKTESRVIAGCPSEYGIHMFREGARAAYKDAREIRLEERKLRQEREARQRELYFDNFRRGIVEKYNKDAQNARLSGLEIEIAALKVTVARLNNHMSSYASSRPY